MVLRLIDDSETIPHTPFLHCFPALILEWDYISE